MQPVYSQSRAVISLAILYIFRMLGLFMVLPVLSLSSDEYLGSNAFLLGIALGIYGLTQACLQIPFGLLSDRFGRKPLIFIGLSLFVAGSLIAALADSVVGLIVGRALQGAGAIAGVIMAMVGDLTSDANRTKAMAVIGASIGVAFALSLVFGPMVSAWTVLGVSGLRLLFWLTVVLSIAGMVVLLWYVPSSSVGNKQRERLSFGQLTQVTNDSQCRLLYVGVFILHYALMVFFVVVPLLLEQVSIVRASHAWVYLGVMLASFIVMVPLMIIGERKQKVKTLLLFAIALLVSALVLIAFTVHTAVAIIVYLGFFFIGFNYLEANLPSLLTKLLPQESRGAGSGVFATSQFLGAALGGIVGGWLYSRWGMVITFGSVIVLLLCWLVMATRMIMPSQHLAAPVAMAGSRK